MQNFHIDFSFVDLTGNVLVSGFPSANLTSCGDMFFLSGQIAKSATDVKTVYATLHFFSQYQTLGFLRSEKLLCRHFRHSGQKGMVNNC